MALFGIDHVRHNQAHEGRVISGSYHLPSGRFSLANLRLDGASPCPPFSTQGALAAGDQGQTLSRPRRSSRPCARCLTRDETVPCGPLCGDVCRNSGPSSRSFLTSLFTKPLDKPFVSRGVEPSF